MRIPALARAFITLASALAVSTIAASTIAGAANEKSCAETRDICIAFAPLTVWQGGVFSRNKAIWETQRTCRREYKVCTEATLLETKKAHAPPPAKSKADDSAKSDAAKVMTNPQSVPLKDKVDTSAKSDAAKVMLNPQPLPPKDKIDASATSKASKVTSNPQPLTTQQNVNTLAKSNASKVLVKPQPAPARVR
jgi:hypothetical protein